MEYQDPTSSSDLEKEQSLELELVDFPIPEKIFSDKEKEDFCEVISHLEANYFATGHKVKTSWKERGEGNSSLSEIYVDAGDGPCCPRMVLGETLEISNTKKPIHILFFQELLAKYHESQGIFYPHIKSERMGDLTKLSFKIGEYPVTEFVEVDKDFAGKEILKTFTYYVMQERKRKGKEFNK